MTLPDKNTWVFGYGSLIWRPDFPYIQREKATLAGWSRRFWQGSEDHRGTPSFPGRVATLVPDETDEVEGMAYQLEPTVIRTTFENLDHREKNGYDRVGVTLQLDSQQSVPAVVYIAPTHNEAWLGDASIAEMAHQICQASGPSGANSEYVFELADGLRQMAIKDDHVFALERALRTLIDEAD